MLSLIVSLMTVGIHATTWEGMIFNRLAEWLKKRLPMWICKPLFSCAICMSSVWTLVFMCFFGFPAWYFVPLIMLIVAGMNTIITATISNIIPDEEVE